MIIATPRPAFGHHVSLGPFIGNLIESKIAIQIEQNAGALFLMLTVLDHTPPQLVNLPNDFSVQLKPRWQVVVGEFTLFQSSIELSPTYIYIRISLTLFA